MPLSPSSGHWMALRQFCAPGWSATRYPQVDGGSRAAGTAAGKEWGPALMTETLTDPLFAAYSKLVLSVDGVPEDLASWAS